MRRGTKTFGELIGEEMNSDPEFRAEWQRLAPAREFAAALIRYRADNGSSQRGLAKQLGVSQPRIAKLESGDHNPEIDTIIGVVRELGIEFCMDVAPAAQEKRLVKKLAAEAGADVEHEHVSVIAASSVAQ